jgi:hypothetical protein
VPAWLQLQDPALTCNSGYIDEISVISWLM